MAAKTREEAIKEMDKQILDDVKRGCNITDYGFYDTVIEYRAIDKNNHVTTRMCKFTPPKPEFKLGTFGKFWDDDPLGFTCRKLFKVCDTYFEDNSGTRWDNFTPIYQTDPIETLAFEKSLADLVMFTKVKENKTDLKALYLKRAKEELSK